ncbi:MAG TPA: 1,4-dihydroxy-6-naphthoate synthase [Bacteroidia bacterium]|nr:1,4-dihydroxy-6-naphthoate synthase [Bacteroidia bacterium]
MKLTLAFSPCPNDTFIFDALVHQRIDTLGYEFEVSLADVEQLNQMAFNEKMDITKLSFHALAHITNHYQLLNAGSALGKGCGPLLVSANKHLNKPIHQLKTAIPGKYTTANFLLSLAYPDLTQKEERIFFDIEDVVLAGEFDAGLIIHENRFTYKEKGLQLIKDLGAFWEEFSGAAIPLGAIAIKRNISEKVKKDIDFLIRKSVEFAFSNPEASLAYTKMHAQNMDENVMKQHIELYVNQYSIDLGEEGKRAVRLLLETALEKQLIPKITEPLIV